jgi:hypothetical protein
MARGERHKIADALEGESGDERNPGHAVEKRERPEGRAIGEDGGNRVDEEAEEKERERDKHDGPQDPILIVRVGVGRATKESHCKTIMFCVLDRQWKVEIPTIEWSDSLKYWTSQNEVDLK